MEYDTADSSPRDYAVALWRGRWIIVTVTVLAAALTLAYSAMANKKYTATADLLLLPDIPTALLQAVNPTSGQVIVNVPTDIQVITSGQVADEVRRTIGSAPEMTATEVGTTNVVAVTATSRSRTLAQKAANAYANAYITVEHKQVASLLTSLSSAVQQRLSAVTAAVTSVGNEIAQTTSSQAGVQAELSGVQGSLQAEQEQLDNELSNYQTYINNQALESGQLITPATLPTSPSSPKTAEYTVLALLIGLVASIAFVLARRALSPEGAVGAPYRGQGRPMPGDGPADAASSAEPVERRAPTDQVPVMVPTGNSEH